MAIPTSGGLWRPLASVVRHQVHASAGLCFQSAANAVYSHVRFCCFGQAPVEYGEMAEWSKAHDWKSCVPPKGTEGSNPSLSAISLFNLLISQVIFCLKYKSLYFILSVFCLVAAGLWGLGIVTERKESRNKFAGFYKEKEDFDVLFIGSSHVLNGVFPQLLWEEYGIVSYNMGGHGNRMALNYWVLKNALEYTTPKCVVVDCYMLGLNDMYESIEQVHISSDHIPYSSTKKEMIEELIGEERKNDFLWEFSTYHHRWNDLKEEDFKVMTSLEKGAESRINVAVPSEKITVGPEEYLEEETLGIQYLHRILEECKGKSIPVLLTYLPFPDSTGWQKESNTAALIAEEYGADYLDFNTLWKIVNPITDFADKDSHMNPLGASKITSYLGSYLTKHFHIPDRREDSKFYHWQEEYEAYRKQRLETIKEQEELKNYLMMLASDDISFGIYLKPGNVLHEYPEVISLLNQLGIDYQNVPKEDYFIVKDRGLGKEHVLKLFETISTNFGHFHLFYNDDGHLELASTKA